MGGRGKGAKRLGDRAQTPTTRSLRMLQQIFSALLPLPATPPSPMHHANPVYPAELELRVRDIKLERPLEMSVLGMELQLLGRVCLPGFYFQHRRRDGSREAPWAGLHLCCATRLLWPRSVDCVAIC